MAVKVLRACRDCGAPIALGSDHWYCDECLKKRRSDTHRIVICQDCGAEFVGYPRSKRCAACARIAAQANNKRFKAKGAARPLGSADKCAACGKNYIVVSGRQKYCSVDCAHNAILALQKTYKADYNKASGQAAEKQHKRDDAMRICAYCGKKFKSKTNGLYCSDYCRKKQHTINQYSYAAKNGYGKYKNLPDLLKERDEYRAKFED